VIFHRGRLLRGDGRRRVPPLFHAGSSTVTGVHITGTPLCVRGGVIGFLVLFILVTASSAAILDVTVIVVIGCIGLDDTGTTDNTSTIMLVSWWRGIVVGRINKVTLRRARLVPRSVTVFGRANHLGIQPATEANSASYPMWNSK